ncbi:MAG: hypothetical protein CMJ72_14830 [Planctomycetaceae bacterium]|nr:hypothetical protein [Planctomycetaceae bacterium]
MMKLQSYQQLLDHEFLPVRAKILEIAAALDRMERASDHPQGRDSRWLQLQEAMEILLQQNIDRTEQLQLHFSRPYDELWREQWGI